jgi:signal transduction histidine kinase
LNKTKPNSHIELVSKFWDFLAYLQKYITVVKDRRLPDTDPARTLLLSTLAEYMLPVLRADLSCIGYRNIENDTNDWIEVVQETIKTQNETHHESTFVHRMAELNWHFPYKEFGLFRDSDPLLLFDEGLKKLPVVFQGAITALVISKVTLLGREYFILFCDVEEKNTTSPRYSEFDKKMVGVALGILEIGFQSGVRRGRKEQQEIEEAQTQQFLLDLVHEIKTPIQAILADASNLQNELPQEFKELREIALRNMNAANHLSLLTDTILYERGLLGEELTIESIDTPLREAINMFVGEADIKKIRIRCPITSDGQPFPTISMYFTQLTIAFKNIIHNAVIYSVPEDANYFPIEIVGHHTNEGFYEIDVTNYGFEITKDEIEYGWLFALKYRGKKARKISARGSGLGLAAANIIIKKHGGNIQIASIPTKSHLFRNTFNIKLPL